jgi:hypothetical protein
MNYQALGEYTQFSRQAKDSADRRFALLYNLARQLGQLSKKTLPSHLTTSQRNLKTSVKRKLSCSPQSSVPTAQQR